MRILNRYIGLTVITASIFVLLVLFGLESFVKLVEEFKDIGRHGYGLKEALSYTALQLLGELYRLFPMAGLLGCMIGLGGLANHHELIVMRASGASLLKVTWAVVRAALLMLLVVVVIGEGVAPQAEKLANHIKTTALTNGQVLRTDDGIWLRSGQSFVHIQHVLPDGRLQGITRYLFDENRYLVSTGFAASALFIKPSITGEHGHWLFHDVKQTHFVDSHEVGAMHFTEQDWQVTFEPRLLELMRITPNQQTLLNLHANINDRLQNGLMVRQYQFAFWQRLFQPLATLVMICLGIPFIFGPLRSVSAGLRVVVGIIIGFCFYTLNNFFGPFSVVWQLPPLLAAVLPTGLFALVGCLIAWRMSRGKHAGVHG